MFRVVIIEDEPLAANRLEHLLHQYEPTLRVLAKLPSIRTAVQWLSESAAPDLLFMDVHLEDGLSFAIAEQVPLSAPVVLTTAFADELVRHYQGRYFAHLQKPINKTELATVLDRFRARG